MFVFRQIKLYIFCNLTLCLMALLELMSVDLIKFTFANSILVSGSFRQLDNLRNRKLTYYRGTV